MAADNNDWWHNIPAVNQGGVENIAGVTLPIDSVAEFSLQTQSSSEVGRNPGGTVNLVTKSGTNGTARHGLLLRAQPGAGGDQSVQYSGRSAALECAMGRIAGRSVLEGPHLLVCELREAEVQHRYRQLGLRAPTSQLRDANAEAVLALRSVCAEFRDEQAGRDSVAGEPARRTISSARFRTRRPSSATATTASSNSTTPSTRSTTSQAAHFWGREPRRRRSARPDINPWYFEIAPIHVYNYSVADNYVFSPSITNSVTIGVNYFNQTFSDAKTGFRICADAGFVTGAPFSRMLPTSRSRGFEPTGNTPPEGRNDITGHLDDAVNWTIGKHQLRLGGAYPSGAGQRVLLAPLDRHLLLRRGQGPNGDRHGRVETRSIPTSPRWPISLPAI